MISSDNDAVSVWARFVQFAPRRIPRIIDRTVQKLRTRPVVDDVDFDAIHGTDTRQVIKVYKLNAVSPSYIHSHGYDACDIVRLRRDLLYLPISRREYEFVDVGCGKGRALIFAAEMGFRKVTGVEISPMLAEVASKNLKICGIEGAILVEDAATFAIPDNSLRLLPLRPLREARDEAVRQKCRTASKTFRRGPLDYLSRSFARPRPRIEQRPENLRSVIR